VAWLSPARFAGGLRSVGYTGGIPAAVLYARLTEAAPGLGGLEGDARGAVTLALVDTVEMINTKIADLEARIAEVFASHPDQAICASLPRSSGTVRAANLLAEIGDCREKFPTDDALAALAGCRRRRGSRASVGRRCSAGRATRNCASP
jgi:transposase